MKHSDRILAGEKRETAIGYDLVIVRNDEDYDEFSWQSCDLCDSGLGGGSRHKAALIKPGTKEKPIYLDVCECCLLYIANGSLCDCSE